MGYAKYAEDNYEIEEERWCLMQQAAKSAAEAEKNKNRNQAKHPHSWQENHYLFCK